MQTKIVGSFFNNHSLSIVNRNLALQLSKYMDVVIKPTDTPNTESKLDTLGIDSLIKLTVSEKDSTPDIEIRHSYPPIWNWPDNEKTKVVYIQPWEFSSIPSEWQYKFDTFADAVITPSNWTRNVFVNSGIDPSKIFVVPNGYNPNICNNEDRTTNTDTITVLFVGCNQYRKGLDVLLKLWSSGTNVNSKLQLIIKDTPAVYGESNLLDEIVRLQYNTKCAPIHYIDSSYSEKEMATLYKQAHILIHPYRGEGFGMHIQEAMACGCIPLVTNGGPTDEFVSNFKIESQLAVVNMYEIFALKSTDSMSNMGGHKFVLEPNINDLANKLSYILNNFKDIEVDVSKLQTWDNVGKILYTTVQYIGSNNKEPRRILK